MFPRWFSPRHDLTPAGVAFDLHNHILPGVDDGSPDDAAALASIAALVELGYRGAVLTPHIHPDAFPNDEDALRRAFAAFAPKAQARFPDFRLRLGAEYYACPELLERLDRQPQRLLRFGHGDAFLLLEFPTIAVPVYADDCLTACRRLGLTPIIAHPERYAEVQSDRQHRQVLAWRGRGALVQINLGSLVGQYGLEARASARALGAAGLVDFLGTDLHEAGQAAAYIGQAWKWAARCRWALDGQNHQRLFST